MYLERMGFFRMPLHQRILIALGLGLVVGVVLNVAWSGQTWAAMGVTDAKGFLSRATPAAGVADPNNPTPVAHVVRTLVDFNTFVGQFFLRALRFVAVPIVLFSLVAGVASLGDLRRLGRIGGRTVLLFFGLTVLSVALGLGLANAIAPGNYVPEEAKAALLEQGSAEAAKRVEAARSTAEGLSLWSQLLGFLPTNPFEAIAKAEMIQVVVASILLGVGVTMLPRGDAESARSAFDVLSRATINLVHLAMHVAPFAVFALIVPVVALQGLSVLAALGVYFATVVLGLVLTLFVMYPLTIRMLTPRAHRPSAMKFFTSLSPAMLLAFSSSSSNATLPVTMDCCRDRLGLLPQVTAFVCPLGATVNMGGTALYQAVAAVFIAQLSGIDLTLAQQATIVLTATLAAIGTPGIPGVGIVMLVIVLNSVGVPNEGIAVILAVDRLLDMCRTVVNITGDAAVAVVIDGLERARPGSAG